MLRTLKKIANSYSELIAVNCMAPSRETSGLHYWQNKLFGVIMTYLLPLSLMAIIPGIIMSLLSGLTFLAVFDSLLLFLFILISFHKKLDILYRKLIFILICYSIAVVLLYFLGSIGPGLLYLLSATVFTVIIFNRKAAYWSVAINFLICSFFAAVIYFKPSSGPLITEYTLGAWIAVSSNLVLLSLIITALVPTIFNGLQDTINEQQQLKLSLNAKQQKLEETVEKLNDKNKELEEFAYMTSHDLQEPLRMVSGFLGLLEKNSGHTLDEKSNQYLFFAKDGAERMKRTITDLLEYSISGTKLNKFEMVNMNDLIGQYVEDNKEIIAAKKAMVQWSNLPTIHADTLSMRQLVQNLIGNGLKYQRKDRTPEIRISHTETQANWQFIFSDNGIGIQANDLHNIFIVFKRLHDRNEYPGTGIGLAICKKIVESHKGMIWVESEPGKGSTFYFTIAKNLN